MPGGEPWMGHMERNLTTPISEDDARGLAVGDVLTLSGTVVTARDEAHRRMLERGAPLDLEGLALYHCGPVMRREGSDWRAVAAGPTTSARLEPFAAGVVRRFRPRLVVGKGGMGSPMLEALVEAGAAYAHFTGGAGALAARAVDRVSAVHWLDDLGMPEAVWVMEMVRFGPLVVTMDCHGRSLHADLASCVAERMSEIRRRIRES